jgi:hypothetical protein
MKFEKLVKRIPLFAGMAFVGVALLLTACGGSGSNSGSGQAAGKVLPPVTLHFKIVGPDDGNTGPDGAKHDTFVALDPQPIAVGQQVTISIENTDDVPHSLTSPELGLNILAQPAKSDDQSTTTTYSFTPAKAGTFRWFCAIPCDSDNNYWDMQSSEKGPSQDNFMAGYITVVNS